MRDNRRIRMRASPTQDFHIGSTRITADKDGLILCHPDDVLPLVTHGCVCEGTTPDEGDSE